MDEHDRDAGRFVLGQPGMGHPGVGRQEAGLPDAGRSGADWSGVNRAAGLRGEPRFDSAADPGRDPHGLEPDRAMPSWRARRGGLDPDLARMGKVAGGLALALVAVAGGWSMLGRRPHEIPVIEAPPGPLRVRPENPGGMQLAGGVDTTPDGVGTLAPPPEVPQPGALRAQIQAGAAAAGIAAGAEAGVPPQAPEDQAAQGRTMQGQADTSAAVPPALHVTVTVPAARGAASSSPPGPAVAPAPAAPGSLSQPATAGTRLAARTDAPSHPPAPAAPDASTIAARPDAAPAADAHGAAAVQLAALESEQGAGAEWLRLQHRMPELLGSRSPEVQRAEHDGHPIWRLRVAGFASLAQAAEFCIQVRAKGTGCSIAAF